MPTRPIARDRVTRLKGHGGPDACAPLSRCLVPAKRRARSVLIASAVSALGGMAATALPLAAQTAQQAEIDSLRVQIEALRVELDSLSALVARGGAAPAEVSEADEAEDALARLRAAARAAAAGGEAGGGADRGEGEPDQEFVGRQSSLQALNPEISVTGDVFGRVGDTDAGSENFFDREFEFSFQSNLDPFSRAKIFASHHAEGGVITPFGDAHGDAGDGGGAGGGEGGGHGGEFAIEEAYLQWVNLPGGFGIKLGRFFQQFGALNRWHGHALQFQSRSLPHLAFIGEETLSQAGASVHWLVPIEGFGTYEVTGELTRSSNALLFGESSGLSVLGHLNGFWQLSPAVDLDLGVSAVTGRHEDADEAFDQRVYGIEGALTWAPPQRSRYRSVNVRGGLMLHDRGDVDYLTSRDLFGPIPGTALGAWVWGEARVGQSWLVGGRWEWVENPEDTGETAWLVAPALTWWQSEFVRLRAEYDYFHGHESSEGQFLLQVTFSMGPHRHEVY